MGYDAGMARYAELHAHSNFSFLDGASHPERLVARAQELGIEALAVTDHDGFYGLVRFWSAASQAGLPAVYGAEVSLPRGGTSAPPEGQDRPIDAAETRDAARPIGTAGESDRWRRGRIRRMHGSKPTDEGPSDHLVLLSPTPKGHAALSKLITQAQFRGEKDRPLYRWEDLAEAAVEGQLVALSGCWQGAVPRAAARGDFEGAMRAAAELRDIFGPRLHLELWDHRMPEDGPRNDLMWEVSQRLALPVVATNNVHYADRHDADLADVLAAIAGRRGLTEHDAYRPASDERYLKSPEEMAARFRRYPGAVERSVYLAESLTFDLKLVGPRLPDFPMPGHFRDEMEYLRHLTFEGALDVYPDSRGGIDDRARQRLEHELTIIERLGFPGYFLVVWDIVNFARGQDIMCQIRGSGADSAVCRCLGLTRVDPIRLMLPFERFLSEERGRPPDIDLDLEAERREEVIQYCYRRYGRERAAMVANVITYRARSRCSSDVGKAFGLTQAQVNALTKYLDSRDSLKECSMKSSSCLDGHHQPSSIYDACRRLDGFPRHLGIHSGGMVVAKRPLWEVVPMEWGRMEDRSVSSSGTRTIVLPWASSSSICWRLGMPSTGCISSVDAIRTRRTASTARPGNDPPGAGDLRHGDAGGHGRDLPESSRGHRWPRCRG